MSSNLNLVDESSIDFESLKPVEDTAPIIPGRVPPPSVSGPSPYMSGVLPQSLGLQPDLIKTGYGNSIPSSRLMPVAPAGIPSSNSATQSVIHSTIVENIQQINNTNNEIVILKTNGALNSSQDMLNLTAGENIDLTSGGSGLVTFDVPDFGPSGASHSSGAVPDPGGSAGTTHFLREDGTWQIPPGTGGAAYYQTAQLNSVSKPQETRLNFLSPVIVTDNPGNTSTDISLPQTVPTFSVQNLAAPVSVTAFVLTTVDSITVTMPSVGGPWRVFARYQYFLNGGVEYTSAINDGVNNDFCVDEGQSINNNACPNSCELSPYTYANSAVVTFTSKVFNSGACTVVLTTSAQGSPSRVFSTGVSLMSIGVVSA